nr:12696_t:CDS:2 [Entrophospora candida]
MVNAVKILLVTDNASAMELIDVLSPFYSATLLLSSSNYSTIGEFHFTLDTKQYFELPNEAKMIASLLDPSTKCSNFYN